MKYRASIFIFIFFFPLFLPAQTKNRWTQMSNFSGGVLEKGIAFGSDDCGYAGTGSDNSGFKKDFWKYYPGKDTWEKTEPFPPLPRISAVAFSIGTKGYVGTGLAGTESIRQGTNDFWEYDTQKKVWSQKANFPGGIRYAAIGFSIGGKGYISLGVNQNTYYKDLWEYNPVANSWNKKADFPENGRSDASVFTIGNDAYVMFGQAKELFPSKKNSWKYSPGKNEWMPFEEFPDAPRVGVIVFSGKNKGYAVGGTNGATKRFQEFWEYDAAKNRWSEKEDVPFGPCAYGFSFVSGNHAYICTGKAKPGTKGPEMWKFDLTEKEPAGNLILGGNLLLGDEKIPLAATEVKIMNMKNEVVKSVFTNLFGSFLFTGLPENEELVLSFDATDPGWKNEKFYIVSRKNENVAVLNKDNSYKFYLSSSGKNKIQLIKVEHKNLRMNMKGKLVLDDKLKTPLKNVAVSLMNEDEEVMQAGTTDQSGIFVFTYLPLDSTVYISIDEKIIPALSKGTKIILMDEGDNVINKTSTAHPEFQLVNIPSEKNSLSQVYMEDPWLSSINTKGSETHVVEYVYFDFGKWEILSDAKAVLNKAVAVLKSDSKYSIEITAHTDSRGDEKSNQELSEKRAEAAKEYMVLKGVRADQISTKGFGETKLLNRCFDGINCSEEEHAQNRRMEFFIRIK